MGMKPRRSPKPTTLDDFDLSEVTVTVTDKDGKEMCSQTCIVDTTALAISESKLNDWRISVGMIRTVDDWLISTHDNLAVILNRRSKQLKEA